MKKELSEFEQLKNAQSSSQQLDLFSCEYEPGQDGKPILTKVVYQRKREFRLAVFSALAVFIAFISLIATLVTQSRATRDQIKQQRSAIQLGDFTKLRANIDIMVNKDFVDSEYYVAKKKVDLEIMPELEMLSDTPFLGNLHRFIDMCYTYQEVDALRQALANIPSATNSLFMYQMNFRNRHYDDVEGFIDEIEHDVDQLVASGNYLGFNASKLDTSKLMPSLRLLGYKDDKAIRNVYAKAGPTWNQIYLKVNKVRIDFEAFKGDISSDDVEKSFDNLKFNKEIPELSNYEFQMESVAKAAMSWLRKERPKIVNLMIAENPVLRNK